jgi:hypothetical protein
VLAAIESQTGQTFTTAQVLHRLKMYLTVMSKDKFYFSTDANSITYFKNTCGCPQLNIADPPDVSERTNFVFDPNTLCLLRLTFSFFPTCQAKKDILRNATHAAAGQGDEFFKKLLTDSKPFDIRRELTEAVLDAFFNIMWTKSDPLHRRVKFVLLKGPLDSKGFIMVKTPGYCNAQLLAPMISPGQ